MNRRKPNRTGLWVLCGLLLAASAAYAAPPAGAALGAGDKDGKMEARMKRVEEQLGVTRKQEKRLKKHRKAHREEAGKLFEEMRQKKEALRNEMEKPDFNMDQVKALHEDLKRIQNKLADHRLQGILEVRQILTPEQFKKFHELTRQEWDKNGKKREYGSPCQEADLEDSPVKP